MSNCHVVSYRDSIYHRTDGIACLCPPGYHGYHCEYEQAQVPVEQFCTLDCANGGTCVLGLVNPSQVKELERIWGSEDIVGIFDQMRCLCPPGFGGPLCQALQETCGEGDEKDDDSGSTTAVPSHYCFHGGQCVTTTTITNTIHGDESIGHATYHCDCTTALDDQGNRFTGDYCQVPSTIFCDKTDPSFFCTHGGTCPRLSHEPCVCPDGFDGHKCEYATTTAAPTPTVSMDPDADTEATSAIPIRCGDIFCLHGSECSTRQGTNGLEEYCDCSTNYRPDLYQAFAGNACQYQATTICPTTLQGEGGGDSSSSSSSYADLSFCVHYGTCLQAPDEDGSQCTCPDGWTGPHCELLDASLDANEDTSLPACGDTVCYHGGRCVQTTVTTQGEDDSSTTQVVEHYCDCTQAYDDEFLYSGKSCEYPSTSICDESLGSEPGTFFCANHGVCLFKNLQQGCICRTGFSGLHCEYLDVDSNNEEGSPEEPLVNQCDDSSYCRNGGTCVTTPVKENGHIVYVSHCDCSTTATETTIFAGPHCEHAATSFCTDPFDGDSTGSSTVAPSTLFCVQGGTCRDNVFEGCDCPVGWTGLRCEYPMDAQELVDVEDVSPPTPCGDLVCYHGGICVASEQEDPVSGDLQDIFSCDCSMTGTTLADGTIEVYGGPTCSMKSTSVCQAATADDPLSALVCMNHGTCRDDPTNGCDCPPGFTGTICDIEVEDDSHKDQGVSCGDSYCYHGGRCDSVRITDPDGKITLMDFCDCAPAVDDDHLYAGSSCQYKSTSFCTHPTQGLSLEGTRFCVNGGTCKQSGDATVGFEQGCDCSPGWTGFSCEFPQDEAQDVDVVVDHEACGDNVCLNGGTCVTTRITVEDGTSSNVQYCDCSAAHDENHLFAGPNCEYPSSTLCANPDPDAANLLGTPFCVNGGICHKDHVLGECSCPSHWTGFRCELPADEVTTDNSVICSDDDDGQFVCQHGGRCDGAGCNCESAIEGTMRYDGLYCQYPATEYCDNPLDESTTLSVVDFCVNGGKCQEGQSCACPTGYYGPRCEMTIVYSEDPPVVDRRPDDDDSNNNKEEEDTNLPAEYTCRLTCANGGSCVKGAKDGSHGVFGQAIGQVAHLNMTFDETLFQHCVCPPGFIGLLCEHVVETCDGGGKSGEHYCFHGSKCVYDSSGKPYCDCDDAQARIDGQLETIFGGASCQHRASDICMADHDDDGDQDPSSNNKSNTNMFLTRPLYFCVNQGQCRDYVTMDDADPGCDCPSEWLGPHCEIYQGVESQLGSSLFDDDKYIDDDDESRTGLLVWTTLLLVMALVYLIVRARRLSREGMAPSPTKPEEEDGEQGEDERGTTVVVGATDHWSSAVRNWFLARRTMGRPEETSRIQHMPAPSSMWSSASSLSLSAAATTKGLPQDLLSGNMNLAPIRRRSTLYEEQVEEEAAVVMTTGQRNTGLSPPSSSSLSPLSDPDEDRQLFVDDDDETAEGYDINIEII